MLVSVPANGLSLDKNYRVSFKFAGQPPPQIFVVWRTSASAEVFQHGFRPLENREPAIDMRGVKGWSGSASSMELGFLLTPGQQVILIETRIFKPDVTDLLKETWESWLFFEPWKPVDVNIYTGTRVFNQGPYPVPFFAAVALLLLALYAALRKRKASYRGAALLIFCSWLALDALWQIKLWRQVSTTMAQYGGIDSRQKLLASEDAVIVRFADACHAVIDEPEARVFIAGSNEYHTMLAAYYMSPNNTFWHRRGPELPAAEYLQRGDYIVLLGANKLNYQRNTGFIHFENGGRLAVREHFADNFGALLEVL